MVVSNNCSRVVPDNQCICNITDAYKILREGDQTVIERVEFVGTSLLDTKCQVEDEVKHKFVLTCNNDEELVPRTTSAPAIVSSCAPSTVLLIILCVILAFIAIALYLKLRKANRRPTANAED